MRQKVLGANIHETERLVERNVATDTHTNTHTHKHTITRYASVCDHSLEGVWEFFTIGISNTVTHLI